MAHSSLPDLSDAVYAVLNVPSLKIAGAKRIVDVTINVTPDDFPFVWYELAAERNMGGLGRGPWLLEVDIRIHVFSQAAGMQEAQAICQEAIRLMRLTPLTVNGWSAWYTPHDAVLALPFELLNGRPVRELVSDDRTYVEEQIAPAAMVLPAPDVRIAA
jgi:hypothetical protein